MRTKPGFWHQKANQREFLDKLATKFQIKSCKQWGEITFRRVIKNGGAPLMKFYGGSLRKALQSVYTEIEWKNEWFRKTSKFWKEKTNQKKFLSDLAKKLQIRKNDDWKSVKRVEIIANGGSSILNEHGGSFTRVLSNIYKDKQFNKDPFRSSKGFWHERSNQRLFFDEIASKYDIKVSKDWGKINRRTIIENGGTTILKQHRGSLWNALNIIYPETKWKREWFQGLSKFHIKYWDSIENQRKFLIEIATKNSISGTRDWRKISVALINKAGGKGLLKSYQGSLQLVLRTIFPNDDWNSGLPLSTQLHLEDKLRAIFWDKLILSNCRETKDIII